MNTDPDQEAQKYADPDPQHCFSGLIGCLFPCGFFINRGIFGIFYVLYSTVSEDAGIELRTVVTLALAVRRYNRSARYHLQLSYISSHLEQKKHSD
jgi:hypothetical protein